MGTHSSIAVQRRDGSVAQIYCHWDGYLDHNGSILIKHYTTQEKAEALVALGDLSSLAESIGSKHDFDECPKGQCNYYGRDRGETEVGPWEFENLTDHLERGMDEEFNYIFVDGVWFVQSKHMFNGNRMRLSEAIESQILEDQ